VFHCARVPVVAFRRTLQPGEELVRLTQSHADERNRSGGRTVAGPGPLQLLDDFSRLICPTGASVSVAESSQRLRHVSGLLPGLCAFGNGLRESFLHEEEIAATPKGRREIG